MNNIFIKSFIIYGLAASISKFIGVFLVPIYTRVFSPEEYGVLDILIILIALFSILGMMQIESSVQRFYFEFKENKKRDQFLSTAFWLILFTSIFIVLTVSIFSTELSILFFKDSSYAQYIRILIFIIPLGNLFAFFTVLFRFLKQPMRYLSIVSIQLIFTVLITVWLVVYKNYGFNGVIYGQIIGFTLPVILCLFWFKKIILISPNHQFIKTIFSYSIPLVPSVASGWVNNYANRFFMIGYLSLADIGIYSVALKIAAIFSLFDAAFRMTWGPFLWELVTKKNHKLVLKKIPLKLTSLLLLAVLLIAVWSKEVTLFVSTENFIEASNYLSYISLAFVLMIILQTINLGPSIIKQTKYNFYISFVSTLISITLLFLLVPKFELFGVAMSLVISNFIRLIISYFVSEKLYFIGFPFLKLLSLILLTFAALVVFSIYDFSRISSYLITAIILLVMVLHINSFYYNFSKNNV
jgi:O-antigen/teichoic acid export membrane protein